MEPPANPQPRLLLWDAHAYAYRAFHAIRHLTAPDGKPTNALYGFIKMLNKAVAQLNPSHIAVVWDGGLAAERMVLLPEYKAQRDAMPSELEQQIPRIQTHLEASGIKSLQKDGVEADDWIGALALQAVGAELPVVIGSADKDFFQLINNRVSLLNPNDKSEKLWTDADVVQKTGVRPDQIVDWLSLLGDAVDNIAGVPGVGPKTAASLLDQFGTVDELYRRLDEVGSHRVRSSLSASKDAVYRNREMVRLKATPPEPVALESLKPARRDVPRLRALYSECGFRSLVNELPAEGPVQGGLFS